MKGIDCGLLPTQILNAEDVKDPNSIFSKIKGFTVNSRNPSMLKVICVKEIGLICIQLSRNIFDIPTLHLRLIVKERICQTDAYRVFCCVRELICPEEKEFSTCGHCLDD